VQRRVSLDGLFPTPSTDHVHVVVDGLFPTPSTDHVHVVVDGLFPTPSTDHVHVVVDGLFPTPPIAGGQKKNTRRLAGCSFPWRYPALTRRR